MCQCFRSNYFDNSFLHWNIYFCQNPKYETKYERKVKQVQDIMYQKQSNFPQIKQENEKHEHFLV